MNYVVFEGLPAVGKSETLELLARFYPHQVRVLPELVKTLVLEEGIDLFTERARLANAISKALPARRSQIEDIVNQGLLCLEESHLGVHYAYSQALNDHDFLDMYPTIAEALPTPDAYVRMDLPVSASLDRQLARGTVQFDIDGQALGTMMATLDRWHETQSAPLLHVDAHRPVDAALADLVQLLTLNYETQTLPRTDTLDVILLLGRPASGKSEFIDFMTRISSERRARDFFIAPFQIVDDFPILWDLFQDDDVWESVGRQRLFSKRSDSNYAVTDASVWSFLIEQINRRVIASPNFAGPQSEQRTLIIEFSRGGSSGYLDALSRLSPDILRRAVALYVAVSFEESWRRNIARYDAKKRDGILTHSVPREEMERTYGTDDWSTLTEGTSGLLRVQDIDIPYATMNNEPESKDLDILGTRYRAALQPLHALAQERLDRR